MKDKKPFVKISGDDCTVEGCEFRGDRPAVETSGRNTRLIRLKAFSQNAKEHPVQVIGLGIVASVIAGVVLQMLE